MIVRKAKKTDFKDMFELFREFHLETLNEFGFECNTNKAYQVMEEHIEHALVLEDNNKVVGMIAGKIIECPLDNLKIYQEMIWYVSKKHRMKGLLLLCELEKQCKSDGITAIIMVAMANSMREGLTKFYKNKGYSLLEEHYIRRL